MPDHIAVVGASLAGLRTVEALRREGFAGRITVIGAEESLPYDRPPLSKQFLVDDWGEEKLALSRDGVEALDAEWKLGQAATSLAADAKRDHCLGGLPRASGARAYVGQRPSHPQYFGRDC